MTIYDKMVDEVIKKYGFEAEETIKFCKLCELKNHIDDFDNFLKSFFNQLMNRR